MLGVQLADGDSNPGPTKLKSGHIHKEQVTVDKGMSSVALFGKRAVW
jgi:hypothetical protein